ncbi:MULTISPECIES: ArsR/SmtB family transcription factor [Paenibacillus]|jgi:predicted transcriptional regulator|uniref:ArsR/SmtB family transcription factor n=1 Tax=Paenibacillus TaxID=44249 RepID=UPI00083E4D38|nr:ArsR family transcriptional regulator [Paenibacillus polymyxa]ODB58768.1 transcriptional regulator [Paenibacillus polymyxa]
MIYIKNLMSGLDIFKALGSEIRIQILELLAYQGQSMNDIANKLNLSNGTITMHIRKLEECGLVEINTVSGKHGTRKMCYLNKDKLMVDLRSREQKNVYEVEIRVGHYSNYQASPTCGLVTRDSIIGDFDDPRYFADPGRLESEMIWMAEGFLEYRIPNYLKANQSFKEIQFSAELGSEAPCYCEEYPSDICFHINGIPIGHWTSAGDFGEVPGVLNPDWWPPHLNQYGMLKLIRINQHGSFIDGCRISEVTIDDINLNYKSDITLRLSVTDQSENKGGLTIFGKRFGNFSQDLLVRVLYDVHGEDNTNS